VCVCVCLLVCVYLSVCVCLLVHVCLSVCECVPLCMCMFQCVCLYMSVCLSQCVCLCMLCVHSYSVYLSCVCLYQCVCVFVSFIDAIRRSLYRQMEPYQQPDFVLPLKVVEQGYRVVYEPEAILEEDPLSRSQDEYRMRVRVALRALHAIKDMAHLMNPLHYGLFAWQLISHKVLRYGAFIPLTILFISGLLLLGEGLVYQVAVGLQSLLYAGALSGWYLERKRRDPGFLFVPFYFCLVNVASGSAFLKMVSGKKQVTWAPRLG